jgi:hypothetical protein
MFLKKHFFVLFVCFAFILNAQTNIKAMFYNTLNYNSDTQSQERTSYLKTILDDIQPDIFMICELKNEIASNYLFENAVLPFNANFSKAEFKPSESPAKSLLQMIYYNSNKLELEYNEVIPTGIRDINHYTFIIKSENSTDEITRIEVFVTHLKASRGNENMQKRLASVENFTRELDRLPEDSFVIFAGDFNFYTSNEPGFQKIIDENNSIQLIDPIDRLCPAFPENGINYFNEDNYDSTYFWNNESFADVHSQSARNGQVNGDGSGGGMDDRFDFIMMSKNFTTSSTLSYKTDSYKTVGNNSNCYNSFVSNSTCTGEFSQELRNALYFFSDHLPITMEMEFEASALITENNRILNFVDTNIAKNSIEINLTKKVNQILIYNQLGQNVFHLKNVNSNTLRIDTESLAKGVYYIKVDSFKVHKFIKI